ncbi:methyl-accepting chemotaxis protein [Rhodobacter capsulatus]|uniref:methyl-accepting chemotaxis protein n=1 Tax=Rhodobacter capsulatus TaxID=1061 RepID=UPI0040281C3D
MTNAPTLASIASETRDASEITGVTVDRIAQITKQMNVLGLNARIEAARVGQQGAGFALVAEEVRKVSGQIGEIANQLGETLKARLSGLEQMVSQLSIAATGTRLVDCAFTAVDLIDRNLYERSCDVRWWATDADLVAAAQDQDRDRLRRAGQRLGVILDAYTVYADIWLVGLDGRVLANGRPGRFPVTGAQVSGAPWFSAAMAVRDGDGFVAGDVETSAHLGGRATMAWATPVRTGGARNGQVIGLLVTQFDWAPQAEAVLKSLRFCADDGEMRGYLVDARGRVLAARGPGAERITQIDLPGEQANGWCARGAGLMGFHRTEGFETWRGKGWFGVVERL